MWYPWQRLNSVEKYPETIGSCDEQNFIYKSRKQGLPSGPVAKTLHLQCSGAQVWFLAGELRSHQKKRKKKNHQEVSGIWPKGHGLQILL